MGKYNESHQLKLPDAYSDSIAEQPAGHALLYVVATAQSAENRDTLPVAVQSDAGQEVINAIKMGDSLNSVTIEGDATALLASAPEVLQWNAKLDK